MSELKAYRFLGQDEVWPDVNFGSDYYLKCSDYYLKSEADKVIAEKDAEIARLKAIRKVHVEAIESMGAGLQQDEEEIRHQKYKRCLAMAEICRHEWCTMYYERKNYSENKFLDYLMSKKDRHKNKWLELAEASTHADR